MSQGFAPCLGRPKGGGVHHAFLQSPQNATKGGHTRRGWTGARRFTGPRLQLVASQPSCRHVLVSRRGTPPHYRIGNPGGFGSF